MRIWTPINLSFCLFLSNFFNWSDPKFLDSTSWWSIWSWLKILKKVRSFIIKSIDHIESNSIFSKPLYGLSLIDVGLSSHSHTSFACDEFSNLTCEQYKWDDVEYVWPFGFHTWANLLWCYQKSWSFNIKSIDNTKNSPISIIPCII